MKSYRVKLNFWTTATLIEANTAEEAKKIALEKYPICDCGCGEKTKVEWVGIVPPQVKGI